MRTATAVSHAELLLLAKAELAKASSLYRKVNLRTLFDPRCDAGQVYDVFASRKGETLLEGLWDVTSIQQDLDRAPEAMTHETSRVEPFGGFVEQP